MNRQYECIRIFLTFSILLVSPANGLLFPDYSDESENLDESEDQVRTQDHGVHPLPPPNMGRVPPVGIPPYPPLPPPMPHPGPHPMPHPMPHPGPHPEPHPQLPPHAPIHDGFPHLVTYVYNPIHTDEDVDGHCHPNDDRCGPPITAPQQSPHGREADTACEWKMVFKAVSRNERIVYDDYMNSGSINGDLPEAKDIDSEFVYRDGFILDNWNLFVIQQVKIEVFARGVRKTWFLFDGLRTMMDTWMKRSRLIASPYKHAKTHYYDDFSIRGDSSENRRFYIVDCEDDACPDLCALLVVADSNTWPNCLWERRYRNPQFLFASNPNHRCANLQDPAEVECGDRFVISVKVCPVNEWLD